MMNLSRWLRFFIVYFLLSVFHLQADSNDVAEAIPAVYGV